MGFISCQNKFLERRKMSDPSYISPAIAIPLALVLWAAYFIIVYGKGWKNNINVYFSERRRQRRERNRLRNYMEHDIKATQAIFVSRNGSAAAPTHRLRSVISK
jgi:uncharacterized membrane protein